jgi:1,4-dihydroxy-2-naphthoyl-CoA synthase
MMDDIEKRKVIDYYKEQIALAEAIIKESGWNFNDRGYGTLVSAVFDKIAKDLFYLQQKWKAEERVVKMEAVKKEVEKAEGRWVSESEKHKE